MSLPMRWWTDGHHVANRSCLFIKLAAARHAEGLLAEAGGHIDLGEAGMLAGVFHLHEQDARQVMTPIPAVVTVDVSETGWVGASGFRPQ